MGGEGLLKAHERVLPPFGIFSFQVAWYVAQGCPSLPHTLCTYMPQWVLPNTSSKKKKNPKNMLASANKKINSLGKSESEKGIKLELLGFPKELTE